MIAESPATIAWPPFVCPRCHGPLSHDDRGWSCLPCAAEYPVVLGIADFRVAPDPWISLTDDHEKARRLLEQTEGASFESTVRAYWEMTPETPKDLADHFTRSVLRGEARAEEWLDTQFTSTALNSLTHPVLDLGCGTGDLLAVLARRGVPAIGIDIAFRWLVQARRRPALTGGAQRLVCCNAEALPFPSGSFSVVSAMNMLEHCQQPRISIREVLRVVIDDGTVRLRTVNRYSVLPEPHVNIWGVGFFPRSLSDRYVRWRSGQRYLHHRLLSAAELRRTLRDAGFTSVRVTAATLLPHEVERVPARWRWIVRAYDRIRRTRLLGGVVALVAPLLDASGSRARVSPSTEPVSV